MESGQKGCVLTTSADHNKKGKNVFDVQFFRCVNVGNHHSCQPSYLLAAEVVAIISRECLTFKEKLPSNFFVILNQTLTSPHGMEW